jgi:hypothetical protein
MARKRVAKPEPPPEYIEDEITYYQKSDDSWQRLGEEVADKASTLVSGRRRHPMRDEVSLQSASISRIALSYQGVCKRNSLAELEKQFNKAVSREQIEEIIRLVAPLTNFKNLPRATMALAAA